MLLHKLPLTFRLYKFLIFIRLLRVLVTDWRGLNFIRFILLSGYVKNTEKNVLYSFLLLFTGGATFYFFPNWIILPITSMTWFLLEVFLSGWKVPKSSIFTGVFLVIFDFIIENIGSMYGFWVSKNSSFFVLAVPMEIILTCFFGGASYSLLMSTRKWNWNVIFVNWVLWTLGGTLGEYYLRTVDFMQYGNGWQSFPHAFFSYLITFIVLFMLSKGLFQDTVRTECLNKN